MRASRLTSFVMMAAVLAVLWVTNSGAVPLMPHTGPATHTAKSGSGDAQQAAGQQLAPNRKLPDPMSDPGILLLVYVVLGMLLLAVLAFLAYAIWHTDDDEEEPERLVEPPVDMDGFASLDVPAALTETASDQLQRIRAGTPRNAIVACWWELERTCGTSGLPRAPYETSSEFTVRILGRFLVDPTVIEQLAGLYREARFSEHELTEEHRERAIAALEQILAGLRAGRASPSLSGPGAS